MLLLLLLLLLLVLLLVLLLLVALRITLFIYDSDKCRNNRVNCTALYIFIHIRVLRFIFSRMSGRGMAHGRPSVLVVVCFIVTDVNLH